MRPSPTTRAAFPFPASAASPVASSRSESGPSTGGVARIRAGNPGPFGGHLPARGRSPQRHPLRRSGRGYRPRSPPGSSSSGFSGRVSRPGPPPGRPLRVVTSCTDLVGASRLAGGDRTTPDVVLEVRDGRFAAVTPHVTDPPRGAVRFEGLTLPGLANVHSHAFHRALRGRSSEAAGLRLDLAGAMTRVADRLDPANIFAWPGRVAEMALAGFTAVGEFHYVHHGPGGGLTTTQRHGTRPG